MLKELTKDFVKETHQKAGVYTISSKKEFGRVKGKSNIIYIGSSNNVRKRLLKLINVKKKHTANKRIEQLKEHGISLFFGVEYSSKYKDLEHNKIETYVRKHLETPPLNHAFKPEVK